MLRVLDIVERESGNPITPELIDSTTQATAEAFLVRMGLTDEMMQRSAQWTVKGIPND